MVQEEGIEAQATSPTSKTILLVEDDQGIGAFLVAAIQQETLHHAILLSDSFQALRAVHDVRPHLLILDYDLPRMNGMELHDHLQAQEGLKDVPTIMIYASLPLPRSQLARHHITGLKKPFDLDQFLRLVDTLLSSS